MNQLNTNLDMWKPNSAFNLQGLQADIQSLGSGWWTQLAGFAEAGLAVGGFGAVPVVAIVDLINRVGQVSNIVNAFYELSQAQSQYLLDPIRTKLNNPANLNVTKVQSSRIKLRMATVSLEGGGDLRYITEASAVLQSDAVTPHSESGGVPPACQPIATQVQNLANQLKGLDAGDPRARVLAQQLNQALTVLQACERANPGNTPLAGVNIVDAVMASAAIPAIFPPVKFGRDNYVDGGVRATLPVRGALANGASNIWAVLTYFNTTAPAIDAFSGSPFRASMVQTGSPSRSAQQETL